MSPSRPLRNLLVMLSVACPLTAQAGAVLIAPLLPSKGVPVQRVADLLSLMSSELEFMEGIDEVIELDEVPTSLTLSCLDSTACLGTLAEGHSADLVLAGAIDKAGDDYMLDLLYYDAGINRVLRRKSFPLSSSSANLLDEVSPMLRELVTGTSPAKKEAEATMSGVEFEEGEDLAFDNRSTGLSGSGSAPPSKPPPPKEEPPPPPKEEPPVEEFDPSMFSFDSSASSVTFSDSGESAEAVVFEDPVGEPPATESLDDPSVAVDEEEEEEEEYRPTPREDDEPRDPPSRTTERPSSSPTRSTSTRRSPSDKLEERQRVTISTRGGYTNYGGAEAGRLPPELQYNDVGQRFGGFHFGTVGAELGVRAAAGLFIVAGIDLHIVQRGLPPDEAALVGKATETNFIYPVNAGLLYRFKAGRVQPYIGADVIFSHIRTECITLAGDGCAVYSDPTTRGTVTQGVDYVLKQHWTVGGRGRLGLDIMLSPHIGFNADVALGYWRSSDWPNLDLRQPAGGFLPHVAGGLVFSF
jgi:hypothetical protein